MSNLLERAIIDAKALKEAALKNAEQLVIEKYSQEVRDVMDQILESDEELTEVEDTLGLDSDALLDTDPMAGEDALAADPSIEETDEVDTVISASDLQANLPDAFRSDDDEVINIKLDSLDDEIEDTVGVFGGDDSLDSDEISIDIEDDSDFETTADVDIDATPDISSVDIGITPEALEEIVQSAIQDVLTEDEECLEEAADCTDPDCPTHGGKSTVEEDSTEQIDLEGLMEKVRVDFEPQKSGWAGTPETIMREYESMLLAREQDSEVKEENAELRKAVAALQKENKTLSSATLKLQEQNKNFKSAFKTLQEKLETMNVSNAKLLYINQALENASLNERQKRKIVEAISKAGTVREAKIIFETMNDTVATNSDVKKETTLSEMVSRKSSLLVAARKEQPIKEANPLFNRMQKLAGIKTK